MEEQEQQHTEDQTEPHLLYHYTTQEGLLGIIQKKEIWATHAGYLNDSSEGSLVSELVCAGYRQWSGDLPQGLFNTGFRIVSSAMVQNTFVASFSEDGDLLSQWRAYSKNGVGFSLGFTPDYLQTVGKRFLRLQDGRLDSRLTPLQKCVYLTVEYKAQLEARVKKSTTAFNECVKASANTGVPEFLATRISARDLFSVSEILGPGQPLAMVKDFGFHEECEWRFAFVAPDGTIPKGLDFRPGSSVLLPYLKVDLKPGEIPFRIERILVGPCPHSDNSVESIRMLLAKEGIQGVEVVPSKIPYRNW